MRNSRKKKRNQKEKENENKKRKFTDRIHPKKGIVSFALGLTALVILLVACIVSYQNQGNAGLFIGLAGFLALLCSITGLIFSILALRQKEIHYRFPAAGGILCGLLTILYLVLYTFGAVLS